MKHSKKPWRYDKRTAPAHSYFFDAKDNCILEITPECLPCKADALLIAAAPEMFEAFLKLCEEPELPNHIADYLVPILRKIKNK